MKNRFLAIYFSKIGFGKKMGIYKLKRTMFDLIAFLLRKRRNFLRLLRSVTSCKVKTQIFLFPSFTIKGSS